MKRYFLLVVVLVISVLAYSNIAVFVSKTTENFYGRAAYMDILNGTFAALDKGMIPYKIITTDEILSGVPEDISLLIIPSNAAITDDEAAVLDKFLLRGGRVVAGYEATLRYPNFNLRPNYTLGNYLGIKSPQWARGEYKYMKLTEEGKKFFGNNVPEYIKMPRGFTFIFDLDGAKPLAVWTKDTEGTPTSSKKNCAIAMTESGIFFGENIFLIAEASDELTTIFNTAVRKLAELPPADINVTKIKLQKLKEKLLTVQQSLYLLEEAMKSKDFESMKLKLSQIEKRIETLSLNENTVLEQIEELGRELTTFSYSLLPSRVVQTRAIWLDHGAMAATGGPENLRKTIEKLAHLGFNVLLPEVIWKGTTISPKLTVYPQNEEFKDWEEDPLEIIIEEAHKYDMEVHAWTWTFAVGYLGESNELMNKNPHLVEKDRFGRTFAEGDNVKRAGFFSHSNPKARELIKSAIKEVVEKYPEIDGINLDYIRYENSDIIDHGYDDYSVKAFKEETGIDPFKIEKYTKEEVLWHLWRENQVTSFVKEISEELKAIKPTIIISADVINLPTGAQHKFKQNWVLWAKNGYVDALFPMAYTPSSDDLRIMIEAEKSAVSGKVFLYPGMSLFVNRDTESVLKQLKILSEELDGLSMFALSYIDDFDNTILSKGLFRKKAVPAHSEPVKIIPAYYEELKNLTEIWLEKGSITREEISWFNNWFEAILEMAKNDEKLDDIWNAVIKMKREVSSNIKDMTNARVIIDTLYSITDTFRPRWYIQSRKGKKPYKAVKPEQMIVVEKPIPIPRMEIFKTDIAPKIDGNANDIAWTHASWSSPFVTYDHGKEVMNKTYVKLVYDDKYLYVLYKAEESDISGMQIVSGKRDTRVYLGDSVECFVWPDEKNKVYYHFVISADGTVYDEIGFDSKWNGYIKAASKVYEDHWIVEIKLDLEELGIDPSSNRPFRMNFNRSRWRGKTPLYTGWSCTYGSFHTLDRFGYVIFK
ncbi:family 10 glycosylhydrolase [Kosmotoga olearia]|nr:family 10 glycosylhydrolase [Kosmotoga olearia]